MPYTLEKKRQYNQRPEVKARQRMLARIRQSTPEYKAKRRLYFQRPEIRERELIRDQLRRNTPEYKAKRRLYRQKPEIREREFLRDQLRRSTPGYKSGKRTYYQRLRCMMEKDYIEWIACVSAVTGHSPYGIIRMNRILKECV